MDLGKSHIVVMWTVGPDEVAAGDAVFQSHGKWMEGHSRQGGGAPAHLASGPANMASEEVRCERRLAGLFADGRAAVNSCSTT